MLPADSPFARPPAPGPHPAPAELRAYAAGTLAPAEEHRIEAHTLDCERCADILTGFSMSDPTTTDQAVAELRARLQARVGSEEPAPVAGGWAWPRIAAAAALLGVVVGGIWTWEQSKTAQPAATARLETAAVAPPNVAAPRQAPELEAAEPAPASTPNTTVAAAPPASKEPRQPADYAAVAPARSRRAPVGQPVERAMDAPNGDALVMADEDSAPAANAEARVAAASPAVASTAPTVASAAGSLAKKPATLAKATSADTLANGEMANASRAFGLKSNPLAANKALDNTASVRVANTPMPAAPTFNPAPVGGTPALRSYLHREAVAFELEEGQRPLSGTVRLRFKVGADGKISDLKVVSSLREDYDEEALRMVCDGPKWQPGIASGRRAALPVELTVTF